VDEVLAVGDAQFQKKCLGKMEDVGKEGRTVLFVSHNLSTIQALCQRCLVLQTGSLKFDQPTLLSIQGYLEDGSVTNTFIRSPAKDGKPTIVSGLVRHKIDELEISIVISTNHPSIVSVDLRIMDSMGIPVGFGSLGTLNPSQLISLNVGVNQIGLLMPTDKLAVGDYYIGLDVTLPDVETYDRVEKCFVFEVNRPPTNNAKRVLSQSWGYGSFEIPLRLLSSS
jgi:lipopolysaccharide transport system ATP-binding protein